MYQTQTVIGQTVGSKDRPVEECTWPEDVLNTIPDWVYTSNDIRLIHAALANLHRPGCIVGGGIRLGGVAV